jgi:hypothetical protein
MSLNPSKRPAIVPSSIGREYYNTTNHFSGIDSYKYRHQEIDVHGSKRLFSRGGHTFFRQFTGDTE